MRALVDDTLFSQTNCLTEIIFVSARNRARELDEYLSKHGRPVGPLHGIPISLKDQFCVKGVDTTMGMYSEAGSRTPQAQLTLPHSPDRLRRSGQ